MKIKIWFFWR